MTKPRVNVNFQFVSANIEKNQSQDEQELGPKDCTCGLCRPVQLEQHAADDLVERRLREIEVSQTKPRFIWPVNVNARRN